MSKAEGKKIGIKFTLPLVGDVEGNENAFTVSGQEYQYTDGPDNNGPLVDKTYEVESVERYGIVPIWKIEEEVKLDSDGEVDYFTPKTYNTSPIQRTGQYRVRWLEDKPTGTGITIEYATGIVQGEWLEVSNGDVITSDTNLWFKVTLETTDTSVTPTLQDLWIEEPDAPNDQIRLIMNDEFRNVQGNITINYNQALGNLSGAGGAVASFTETFTPIDLEEGLIATGGAYGTHEHIEASVGGSIDMLYITKQEGYAFDENIQASVGGSILLKHIDDINP